MKVEFQVKMKFVGEATNHGKEEKLSLQNVHANEIMESDGWSCLVRDHPPLLAEVFRALATQQTPPIIMSHPPRKRLKHL
uniref:Bm10786 n=1 Tax=Brugia malayi TaxID=6279 RepID=A0A0J9Y0F3_BRUMA|nr:Bm10786 [Brugia malayi]